MELKRFNAFAVRCTFAECKLEEKGVMRER